MFLLETANSKILVDCGLFQGAKSIRERNYEPYPIPPGDINAVLITHAHIDHCGLIPKLVKYGFRDRIYATSPTVELMKVLLPDSGHIQEMEIERKNRKNRRAGRPLVEPYYTVEEAYKSLANLQGIEYNQIIQVTPDIRARFVDAGHILGSAMIEIWVQESGKEVKLVFSGDIGNNEQPIVEDPSTIDTADYLIMESTYGNRLHQTSKEEIVLLREAILDTYQKGGNLIIPAFAVERTQDLLYHLSILIEQGEIPQIPVYIDSPLAIAATEIFHNHPEYYDQETIDLINRGGNPFQFPGIRFTQTTDESRALNEVSGAIIISASGMCDAGRIRHHLKYNLWRPESTVLFVGYQAEGTLGRRLLDGAKKVRILGDDIAVKADIRFIDSYSAHADQAGLIAWVKKFKVHPGRVFLVHGEQDSLNTLAALLRDIGLNVTVPKWQETFELHPESYVDAVVDPVNMAIFSLNKKIKTILDAGIDKSQKDELLRRLVELQHFVDNIK